MIKKTSCYQIQQCEREKKGETDTKTIPTIRSPQKRRRRKKTLRFFILKRKQLYGFGLNVSLFDYGIHRLNKLHRNKKTSNYL